MAVGLIRFAELPILPWRNGAGRRVEIAAEPGWSLGFAWLDRDAPFSHYPDHDRTITLLSGPGFTLHFPAGGADMVADAAFRPRSFDGGQPAECRIAGPCFVFNVMTERPRHAHRLSIIHGPARVEAGFAVLFAGTLATPAGLAEARDTLRLADGAALDVPAGTTVAAIHISPP